MSRQARPAPARVDRPAVDEWGIYDPSQAGLEALYERVEARRRAGVVPDAQSVAASIERLRVLYPQSDQKPESD